MQISDMAITLRDGNKMNQRNRKTRNKTRCSGGLIMDMGMQETRDPALGECLGNGANHFFLRSYLTSRADWPEKIQLLVYH